MVSAITKLFCVTWQTDVFALLSFCSQRFPMLLMVINTDPHLPIEHLNLFIAVKCSNINED